MMKFKYVLPTIIFGLILNASNAGTGGLGGGSKNGKLNSNMKWDTIIKTVKKDYKLKMDGTTTFVGQPISIFDVCVDGDHFKTTRKFPVYKNVQVPRHRDNNDSERDGWAYKVVGHEYKTYPLNTYHRQRECENDDRNCRDVEVEFNQNTYKMVTVKKHVRTVGSDERKIYKKLFSKLYQAPECKSFE